MAFRRRLMRRSWRAATTTPAIATSNPSVPKMIVSSLESEMSSLMSIVVGDETEAAAMLGVPYTSEVLMSSTIVFDLTTETFVGYKRL